MNKISEQVFCAFCRLRRKVYSKRRLDWTNVLLSIAAAVLTMFILWQGFDARVMMFFVAYLSVAEAFIQVRRRLSLPCPYCGFDPILYTKSPERAAERVKAFLSKKMESPEFFLSSKNPFQTLPKRKSEPAAPLAGATSQRPQPSQPRILSKQI